MGNNVQAWTASWGRMAVRRRSYVCHPTLGSFASSASLVGKRVFDPIRQLWSVFFIVTTVAVIVTAVRLLSSEQSKLFKTIAVYVILAAGISGFVAACAVLIAP
jgi:hypothetical protein